ncbi:MAG: YDG domain-containing protein, partial [Rhodoferax sp.]|nr:YDG domain-containing protein [Rhodoferax sp.]
MAINWQTFDIGAGYRVRFIQPSASSVALNRVIGGTRSEIYGNLSSNGQVFLINPNGVLFGKTAEVDVGGLFATTRDLSPSDFMNAAQSNWTFGAGGQGEIINQGHLRALPGGAVVLVADVVRNQAGASITAQSGVVHLASASDVEIKLNANGSLTTRVSGSTVNTLLENGGLIAADGGQVYLTALGRDTLVGNVMNLGGVVRARSLGELTGGITVDGGSAGNVELHNATLDASGLQAGERGGQITVTGHNIGLFGATLLDAKGAAGGGTVKVGGDYQGAGTLAHADALLMGQDAVIDVSATDNGEGGTAVLWSDKYTQFGGRISSKGGALGGNGGLIETSSKGLLQSPGTIELTAAKGKGGTWLLDPADITITPAADSAIAAGPSYVPTSASAVSNINAATISNQLASGVNVSINTANTGTEGTGNGDITVAAAIAPTTGAGSLTLTANRNIYVNNTITLGAGNIALNANGGIQFAANVTTGGAVTVNPGTRGSFYTNFGTSITAASFRNSAGTSRSYLGGNISTNTANGDITFNGAVTLANDVVMNAGTGKILFGSTLESGAMAFDKVGTWSYVAPRTASNYRTLVVGGGGAGGARTSTTGGSSWNRGGGGGAGDFIESSTTALTQNASYAVVVGAGGEGLPNIPFSPTITISPGSNSQFATTTAGGGGAGAPGGQGDPVRPALGSGGGGGAVANAGTSQSFGQPGSGVNVNRGGLGALGVTTNSQGDGGGGGGGAGGNGVNGAANTNRSQGGAGLDSSITGTTVNYAAGGDGATSSTPLIAANGATPGSGGNGADGTEGAGAIAGSGANGIVVVRANTQASLNITAGEVTFTGNVTPVAGNRVNALTINGANVNGAGSISATTLDLNAPVATGSLSVVNAISGSTTVNKLGVGSYTMSGANASTGSISVNAGMLKLATRVALFNGVTGNWVNSRMLVDAGTSLVLNYGGGVTEFAQSDVNTLITNLSTGSAGFRAGATLGLDTTNAVGGASFAGVISDSTSGALNFTKLGSNTLTVSGVNTYTGSTVVDGGTLRAGSTTAFGNTDKVTLNSGTVLDVAGRNVAVGSLVSAAGVGTVTNTGASATLTMGGASSASYGGVLQNGPGNLAVTKVGAGTQTLAGDNTYSGNTAVNGGVLNVTSTLGAGNYAGAITLASGTQLSYANNAAATQTLSGQITGSGAIAKNGNSTLTLRNVNNTYTGGTTINSGTLNVGDGTQAMTTVSGGSFVNNGAALIIKGIGPLATAAANSISNIDGTVTLQSTGNVTVAGNITRGASSNSVVNIYAGTGTAQGVTTGGDVIITAASGIDAGTVNIFSGKASTAALQTKIKLNGVNASRVNTEKWYNESYSSALAETPTATKQLNVFYREAPSLTANGSLSASGTVTSISRQYNASTDIDVWVNAASGGVDGDVLTGGKIIGTMSSKDVGTRSVNYSGNVAIDTAASGVTANVVHGYTNGSPTALSVTVTKANATVTATSNNSLTYNGVGQTVSGFSAAGLVGGETAAVLTGVTGSTTNKNAGSYTTTVSGTDGNYNLTFVNGTMTIAKATITASGITAADKVYDGGVAATLNTGAAILSGKIASDTVNLAGATGSFSDKNVANGKTVSINGLTLTGADAANYTLASDTSVTTASITPASITAVTGITAANKVYDGGVAATVDTGAATLVGKVVATDDLSVGSATGNFGDKNVGQSKTVTVSGLTLTGADAANYTLASDTASTTANITPASITAVTGITAANKVYDGGVAATVDTGSATLVGKVVATDDLSVGSATGNFGDKNVGQSKTVSINGLTLTGADAA